MTKFLDLTFKAKIKTLAEIEEVLEQEREKGIKIIQCHGVFDLLHLGHIRHFRHAKAQGGCLVVTLTPDRFVNKGPGRPAFQESLRLEAVAALSDVDFVVLNDSPDAVSAIRKIRPALFVKGSEYQKHAEDITGKIFEEVKAVEEVGGGVYYTDDVVFSSSSLLNQYFNSLSPPVVNFISKLKQECSYSDILKKVEALSDLKVLIIGDAIIDEYQYIDPLGQSGKGCHMVARTLDKEVFLGGSLILANHIAQFANEVTLITALGNECPYISFIRNNLDSKIRSEFVFLEETTTLIKKRYVIKDGKTLTKLFETYSGQEDPLHRDQTGKILKFLDSEASKYDLVLCCDFGNGFTNPQIIDAISSVPSFLALNTQMNSGNRGYNVVTNYHRADYVSLNEPELRLAVHNKTSPLDTLAFDICQIMNCSSISVTRGVNGVASYSNEGDEVLVPALITNTIDRIGAGDSYFALASLCAAKGYPLIISSFLGSLAAAMSVQIVGNQEPIKKIPLLKFLTRMLK